MRMKPGSEAENTETYLRMINSPPSIIFRTSEYNRYKCSICGEEVLTYVHAERHGFTSKQEMIDKGLAIPISNKKGKHYK